MASYIELNDLGSFASIEALWAAYPEGGHEGDYCTIDGTKYHWDKYTRMWGDTEPTPTPSRPVTTFYGDVNIHNDLKVAGTIRAKGIKQPCVGLFPTLVALQAAYPSPEVGMWAVVGDTMPGPIYRCSTEGVWAATGEDGGVDEIDLTDYAHVADVPRVIDDVTTGGATDALSAEQGKKLNDRLEVVEDAIFDVTEYDINSEIIVSDHNWILSGGIGTTVNSNPSSYANWSCMRISVLQGDMISISTIGGNTARAWALTNTARKILSVAESTPNQQTIIHYSIEAEQDGFLYVNCSSLGYLSFKVVHYRNDVASRITVLESEQDALRDDVDAISEDLYNTESFDSTDLEEGELGQYWKLAANGSPVDTAPSSPSSYTGTGYWACIPEPISVKVGDVVTISTVGGGNARAWAFTDMEGNLLTNDETHEYVAEANRDSVSSPYAITVERNGFLYVNFKLNGTSSSDFYIKVNSAVIDGLVAAVDTLTDTVDGLVKNTAGIPRYKNNPLPLWKDTLKVLAIGNSYTEDFTAYLNALVGSSGANIPLSKLCVYTLTQSSSSLQTWVNNYESGTSKTIYRVAGSITMGTTSGTVAQILAQDWDVVIMQQLSTYANKYNTFNPYLTKMIGYIKNCTNQQVALAWQSVWSYREGHSAGGVTYGDSEERWGEICAATKQMMHKDGIDIIIPTGTAIQNARSYQELDPTFNAGNIDDNENIGEVTRDGTHLEFGVGRYIAACTFFQTLIAPMFGVSVLGNPAVHTITNSEQSSSQNVYKGVSVDSGNKALCQLFAFAATINKWSITDVEDESFTASIALNTPSIYDRVGTLETTIAGKQDTLVSGTNIKTVNNQSLLGSGNITIQGGGGSGEQSDWNESDTSSKAYIQNKPTIPTVPTNVSAFNNDAGYLNNNFCPIIEDTRSSRDSTITGIAPFASLEDKQMILLHTAMGSWSTANIKLTLSNGVDTDTIPFYCQRAGNISRVDSGTLSTEQYVLCIYDDTNTRWLAYSIDSNTEYSTTSSAEIQAGTGTGNRVVTPKLIHDNAYIVSLAYSSGSLEANKFYDFGTVSSALSIPSLDASNDLVSNALNFYALRFIAGADNLNITFPTGVEVDDTPTINTGDYVEIMINLYVENNTNHFYASIKVWQAQQ